ncbi:MAG: 4Fe-4S dicluster domain-containing protein [Thermodesulfobacteriota bacterium]
MKPEVVERVRAAGVVGAGGAGFPTHVKIDARVEVALANGASCEPLLKSDVELMARETEAVLTGLEAVMAATAAKRGLVCLKAKHEKALAALEDQCGRGGFPGVEIEKLGDFYPAGDEMVLVYEVLGRVTPEGGLPLEVGAVVGNVESLVNVAAALEGRPVTERRLTVAGEVRRSIVAKVPIGLSLGEVIDLAGGPTVADFKVVLGGPMMGLVTDDLTTPVTKTTSGIIVLPAGHNVITGKIKDPERIRYITKVACCQCSRCTDLCPRRLLGHGLEPHKIMRQLGSPLGPARAVTRDALICSECGVCEKFACPMMISPREVNARIKKELLAGGVKRLSQRETYTPSAFREVRRVPTSRLIERLNLGRYDRPPEYYDQEIKPRRVVIPLKQHLGAPARAVVQPGDWVRKGDLIGEIPDGVLGARVHASLEGRVAAVDGSVVIEA